jgi:uncharacterized protein YndB with AHSA1/START domain
MDGFSLTTHISAPPKTVFTFLADAANMTLWYEAVDQVALRSDTEVGQGSRFQLVRSLPGGRAVNVVEVTEFEPDRRLTLESRSGPTPFRYAFTLFASEHGTALTLDGRISAEGVPGPAEHLGALAARLFSRGMQRNLRTLKHLLEVEVPRRSSSF